MSKKNIGEQIVDAVQDAIDSQDFSRLNEQITNTIGVAADNISRSLKKASQSMTESEEKRNRRRGIVPPPLGQPFQNRSQGFPAGGQPPFGNQGGGFGNPEAYGEPDQARGAYSSPPPASAPRRKTFNETWINDPYRRKNEITPRSKKQLLSQRYVPMTGRKVSYAVATLLGGCLLATGILAECAGPASGMGFFYFMMWMILFILPGAPLFWAGLRGLALTSSFESYKNLLGLRTYCDVKELAASTGKSVKKTVSNLRIMLKKGWFLHGYLDQKGTCLMVTEDAWQMYQAAQSQYIERQKEAFLSQKEEESAKEDRKEEAQKKADDETEEFLAAGQDYLRQIRACNDAIADEEISEKIIRIEMIVGSIFQRVEENPEVIRDLKRLMDYYLPTTVKLLKAYEALDRQTISVQNVESSKKEIADTLDTLNVAFEKLLDSVFQDLAWDVSTDISVLHTILAQEGLTDDGFEKMKTQEKPKLHL